MGYPADTVFNPWTLTLENQRNKAVWCIKRWVRFPDGRAKLERLPTKKYRLIRDNEEELKKLVIRMNEKDKPTRTKEAVTIKHAFISPEFLDRYKDHLVSQTPSKKQALTEYNSVYRHALLFFISELNLADPLAWHEKCDVEWANYLLSDKVPKSRRTLQNIIEGLNRFMAYLHKRRPAEVPPLIFKPFTKARFKEIESQRRIDKKVRIRSNIKDEHWAIIRTKMKDLIIEPWAYLSYNYGLRRAESLGLQPDDVKKGYLLVERQLKSVTRVRRFNPAYPKYGPPKGRNARKIPHAWFCSPEQALKWIKQGKLLHPDTLSDLWTTLMVDLGLSYDFHDLRHSWCTRAVRINDVEIRDVMLAAGHENIETTMRYLHDDRALDDETFSDVG